MTIKDAINLVRKNNPKNSILLCEETDNWFKFSLGDEHNAPLINSSTYAVNKKTGKGSWINYFGAPKEYRAEIPIHIYSSDFFK